MVLKVEFKKIIRVPWIKWAPVLFTKVPVWMPLTITKIFKTGLTNWVLTMSLMKIVVVTVRKWFLPKLQQQKVFPLLKIQQNILLMNHNLQTGVQYRRRLQHLQTLLLMPQQKKAAQYQPRKFYLLHLKRHPPKKVVSFQPKHQQCHLLKLQQTRVALYQQKKFYQHHLKIPQLKKDASFQLKHQQLQLKKFYQRHLKIPQLKKDASFQPKHQQLQLKKIADVQFPQKKFYLLHLKILQQLKKDA